MSISEPIDQVRAALDRDPRIPHAAEVAVSERDGVVTLRGSVASFRQRRAAVQIARAVEGVREVEDELSIDLQDHFEDDDIRGTALQTLIWDPDVPDDQIDVSVRDGWLTLKGEVRHQHESDAAFEDVSRLRGVGGITNEIKVITAGGVGG
jgi:osmotically-inducible protein OsmY